ncbi:MAG TPA: S8 family serine peptidase [Candidatus Kapabacteria bacterium]|nr:S8 family serine peptidase [Candidatus Kapabacteria bacterium]
MNTVSRISSLLLLLLVSHVFAQGREARSIIVKFRSAITILAPSNSIQKTIRSVSTRSLQECAHITPVSGRNNIQSTHSQYGLDRTIVVLLSDTISAENAVNALSAFPEIEYAEPNYIYHIDALQPPNDSLYAGQWAHTVMDVLGAWQTTQGDTSIHIGFVDTGVEWDHPDLVGQFALNSAEDINHNGLFDPWPSTEKRVDAHGDSVYGDLDGIDEDGNGYVDDVIGYDFVDQESINFGDASGRDPIPQDEGPYSHGTAVAGVIAAKANNKIGVAGIAPGCRLVALRAFDATGNAESDDIASAIIYAADNGVRILNLSFGDVIQSKLQRDAIRYANDKGVLVVASSGNDGSDGRHYPSDFDECVSVGMTAQDNTGKEVLAIGSSHGEGMDIIAPGQQILTTAGNGGYQYISGTSFSSPATAAVAGLILAHNNELTNTDVRSILESTTDYISASGYDHNHANGRVNAKRAVEFLGGARIKITSQNTDDVILIDSTVSISGSAASTLFKSYTISFAMGLNPDNNPAVPPTWTLIDSSDKQVIGGNLANWNTSNLIPGIYTLRLAIRTSDSRSVEERMTITLAKSQPFNVVFNIDTMYENERRILLIRARSDVLTNATLYYRSFPGSKWSAKNDDLFAHGHFIKLNSNDIQPGVPIDLKLVTRANSKDSVALLATSTLPNDAIDQSGFVQKNYSLPSGYLLDTIFSNSQGSIALESIAPGGADFGYPFAFIFNKVKNEFTAIDSLQLAGLPRSVGNVLGDGVPEFLISGSFNSTYIYKPNATHPVFGDIVFSDTTSGAFYPTLLADIDGDEKDELIGLSTNKVGSIFQSQYEVDKISSGTRIPFGSLVNPTPPAPHFTTNNYNTPDTRSADFLGDGHKELVILDDDADLLIYKFNPNSPTKFDTIFTDQNDGYTEGRNFAIGDFNGDGKPDIALAFHTSYDVNADNEYDPSYWTLKVFLNQGGGSFKTIYQDHFYLARSQSPYRSSVGAIHNVTGSAGDNLVLSFFPNFYLFGFDVQSQTIVPQWQYPVANSPRGATAFDFDGNGKREFGFDTGDSIHFFERVQDIASQTPPPAGLDVIPRDSNRVGIRWANEPQAAIYYILRADDLPTALYQVIDSTTSTTYSDTTVVDHKSYIYSVQAYSPNFVKHLSDPALGIAAYVHPKPFISIKSASERFLVLHTSQPVSTHGLSGGEFVIDDSVGISTAIISGDSSVTLTLLTIPESGIQHSLRVRSTELRDVWSSPFDTSRLATWKPATPVPNPEFYITRWRFEGASRIHIEFSMRPDDNALVVSHYSLTPFGRLLVVSRDPANDSAVFIDLAAGSGFAPIGKSYVICTDSITSNAIPIIESGSCAGETPTAPSLEHLFVYPNPAKSSDETLTFAGLTAQAQIAVYSQDLHLLKRLSTFDHTGGLMWDMRDEAGELLPSGIYLYHVTGKDDIGNDVAPFEAKFVIIRN